MNELTWWFSHILCFCPPWTNSILNSTFFACSHFSDQTILEMSSCWYQKGRWYKVTWDCVITPFYWSPWKHVKGLSTKEAKTYLFSYWPEAANSGLSLLLQSIYWSVFLAQQTPPPLDAGGEEPNSTDTWVIKDRGRRFGKTRPPGCFNLHQTKMDGLLLDQKEGKLSLPPCPRRSSAAAGWTWGWGINLHPRASLDILLPRGSSPTVDSALASQAQPSITGALWWERRPRWGAPARVFSPSWLKQLQRPSRALHRRPLFPGVRGRLRLWDKPACPKTLF